MLFLPMTNIGKVERFSALEGESPELSKLSSKKWENTKLKVRKSVETLAGDLIKLYAARKISKGFQFKSKNSEDELFSDGFAYQETPDQLDAIQNTLKDMVGELPMDLSLIHI